MARHHLLSAFVFLLALGNAGFASGQKAPEIPSGTKIKVRVIDRLSSEEARTGDEFHATLEEPIVANDHELYPRGADVTGRVVDVHPSGRLSEPGELDLVINAVTSGARTSSLRVDPLVMKGESHTKSNATKIGGGAALGAIIGAIAGGGKGAAVGTIAGGAAGTGAAAATGKKAIVIAPETVLSFVTSTDVAVTGEHSAAETTSTAPTSATGANSAAAPAAAVSSDSLFSLRDQRVIRNCVAEHSADLTADATQRADLPSGDERNLRRDGVVPDSIAPKMQSLPLACDQQLPKLPADQERVVYAGRVMLINGNNHILDIFDLQERH